MLLIPIYERVDWRNPPLITVLLILTNCFIFFIIQADDEKHQYEALEYYFESELPKIEFPAYIHYLEDSGQSLRAMELSDLLDSRPYEQIGLLLAIEGDSVFLKQLRSNEIITEADPVFTVWTRERARYEALVERSVTYSYGFKPAEPQPVTLVTHMFLHGGVGHLLGNMIILFLIGIAVETALGRPAFLISYLLGGLLAVTVFSAVHSDSAVPLVGASGAIAAVMGIYTVLFGKKKIRFFYSILFYFDFIKAPAIILLPLWLLNEFYQLLWGGISNVAYVAHIGGLLGGAGIALIQKRFHPSINTEYLDQAENEQKDILDYEKGMALTAALKLEEAKRIFSGLLSKDPQNRSALIQLHNIAKFKPESDDYHNLALRIIGLPNNDAATLKLVNETFRDYIKTAQPVVRLSYDRYLDLAIRFAAGSYIEDVEKIINFLLKNDDKNKRLPQGLLALAECLLRVKSPGKSRNYLQLLMKSYPHSNEAEQARRLMKWASAGKPS